MPAGVIALSIGVALAAGLTIWAQYQAQPYVVYFCKPLTTSLIITLAAIAPTPVQPIYKAAVFAGLVLSLIGDVLLMLPADHFRAGLVSFLLAHVAYLVALVAQGGVHISGLPISLAVLYMAGILRVLWPHLGRARGPVIVYMLVISVMVWQAFELWRLGDPHAGLAFPGALLFLISDSALAIDRFARPFRARPIVVLGTYWAAQWLIALSIR